MCENITVCCEYIAVYGLKCESHFKDFKGVVDDLLNPTKCTIESVWDILKSEVSKGFLGMDRQNSTLVRCCVEYLHTYTRAKVI